jgi:hypothetical protein
VTRDAAHRPERVFHVSVAQPCSAQPLASEAGAPVVVQPTRIEITAQNEVVELGHR